jgi:hypothetical protein
MVALKNAHTVAQNVRKAILYLMIITAFRSTGGWHLMAARRRYLMKKEDLYLIFAIVN